MDQRIRYTVKNLGIAPKEITPSHMTITVNPYIFNSYWTRHMISIRESGQISCYPIVLSILLKVTTMIPPPPNVRFLLFKDAFCVQNIILPLTKWRKKIPCFPIFWLWKLAAVGLYFHKSSIYICEGGLLLHDIRSWRSLYDLRLPGRNEANLDHNKIWSGYLNCNCHVTWSMELLS